jgi:hypothetical protein
MKQFHTVSAPRQPSTPRKLSVPGLARGLHTIKGMSARKTNRIKRLVAAVALLVAVNGNVAKPRETKVENTRPVAGSTAN